MEKLIGDIGSFPSTGCSSVRLNSTCGSRISFRTAFFYFHPVLKVAARYLLFAASLLLVTTVSAASHDFLQLREAADELFEAQNPNLGNLNEKDLEKRAQAKVEFGLLQLNEHFNTDWPADGVLDSFLNLVAECPLPPEVCEKWVSGRFVRKYSAIGDPFMSMRLLSDAVPHIGMPLPHRCAKNEISFISGMLLPTETRHMAIRTTKSDAATPCFIRPVE